VAVGVGDRHAVAGEDELVNVIGERWPAVSKSRSSG
jgi:hypothetical protein